MSEPFATLSKLLSAMASGATTASAVTEAALARITATEPVLHAFLAVESTRARAKAHNVDQRRARGEPLGPLAGIPIAVKDNILVRGTRTTAASRILDGHVAQYDADVVERLERADAVILGKTNLDEFAMGSSTENSAFGPSHNPWDPTRMPGGSSGGSAVAVASGQAVSALGTDTGGSIRQPAALTGIVGMKPTYGRVSRYGVIAFASSLDQVGPFARTVEDLARVLSVIAGHDPRDSTSLPEPVPDYVAAVAAPDVRGVRLGVPREYFGEGLDPAVAHAVRDAIEELARAGAEIVELSLPYTDKCLAAYYVIAPAEASSNLARYDGVRYGLRDAPPGTDLLGMYKRSRGRGFGSEVKRRIILGTYALSAGYYDAYYGTAQRVRTLIRQGFLSAFERCDAIVCPTSPVVAPRLGEKVSDPLAMYLMDIYTISANLAGLPGLSMNCGFSADGLPIGLQLLGRPLDEAGVLRVAAAYEARTDWHRRHPPAQE